MSPLPKGRERYHSDEAIIQALAATKSVREAAKQLGYAAAQTLYARAQTSPAVRAAIRESRAPSHPGFRNMLGETKGTWKVLERGENTADGNAQWKCRHVCGAVHILLGTLLRTRPPKLCRNCRTANRENYS